MGLKQVFHALASYGENETVYRMVMNPTAPSYRHHVEQGLTTLPEYWNYTELWNGLGRSRNHAMMGHVKEWLCRSVLGIMPLEPGYRRLRIRPWLHAKINRVEGSLFTVRGNVRLECRREGNSLIMRTDIPVGAQADVCLPYEEGKCCYLDGEEFRGYEKTGDGYLTVSGVPSGSYRWEVKYPAAGNEASTLIHCERNE